MQACPLWRKGWIERDLEAEAFLLGGSNAENAVVLQREGKFKLAIFAPSGLFTQRLRAMVRYRSG